MFLFGLYAGRRRLFERAAQQTAFIRRAIVGTLVAGFLASPTIGWLNDLAAHPTNGHLAITFRQAISAIQAAAFSLAYGLIALYLIERFRLHRRLAPIASIGRMALTNYLMLSVLVSTTFYSYGLGLYGRVTVLEGITLAGTAFMALAAASSWWLRRFRFGPAEWVWRSLTYGTMQPMKGAARSLPS